MDIIATMWGFSAILATHAGTIGQKIVLGQLLDGGFMALAGINGKSLNSVVLGIILSLLGATFALGQGPPTFRGMPSTPGFSKSFSPSTIGPGNNSTLTFVINGSAIPAPVSDLAFTDTLPAGVVISDPSSAVTDCADAMLMAPPGGSTIGFMGGRLGAGETCTVSVNVTSSTPGVHNNLSSTLTSSAGASGTASANLTVDATQISFDKQFSPTSIVIGGTSTLTFSLSNPAGQGNRFNIEFNDFLPLGLVVANPPNVVTDCTATIEADAGTDSIRLFSGFLMDGQGCSVSVDVTGSTAGTFDNVTTNLLSTAGTAGFATDSLDIVFEFLAKQFIDDPAAPGETTTLQFTITNVDRSNAATNLSFTDDLDAVLSGLVAVNTPIVDPCGPGSTLTGTSLLSFSGGNIPAEGNCVFSVTLQVPIGAATGTFPNTTSVITGDLGGSPLAGNAATASLDVLPLPVITKTIVEDSVVAGGTVTLQFEIRNTSNAFSATSISFIDNLDDFIPDSTAAMLPSDPCGAGSTIFQTILPNPLGGNFRGLLLSGGTLPPSGTCNFQVEINVPAGTPPGDRVNTASDVTATVNGLTVVGIPDTDSVGVVGAPIISKVFTDDPVLPGDTVTLEFTLELAAASPADANGIAFTDDLDAALSGLVAVGLPLNDPCGPGSLLTGTSTLSFTGGSLTPGSSCTFSVTLQVPVGALPGNFLNTTGPVTATVGASMVTGGVAADDLIVASLTFTKAFNPPDTIPGRVIAIDFSISNLGTQDAATISFSDNLNTVISGLSPIGLPLNNVCGAGSILTSAGGNTFALAGGSLLAGQSCNFSLDVQVPVSASVGEFVNNTSNLSTTVGGQLVFLPGATAVLNVVNPISITKEFLGDPVPPGGTVMLRFTITNDDPVDPITAVTFTDDLNAALAGLAATGLPATDVCGVGSTLSGAGLITLTGGSIPASGSCTFDVTLQVPAGATLGTVVNNVTSSVGGMITGVSVTGSPATDDLEIQFLTLSKAFAGPAAIGGTITLSFTIENLSSGSPVSGISFSDDLDAVLAGSVAVGLPAVDVCGVGSTLAGTSLLTLSNGSLGPGGTCNFDVTVQVPGSATVGTFPNTTSDLFVSGLSSAPPGTDDLVVEPPPLFAKEFVPDQIAPGAVSRLTFTVDNSASALAASALDFTDNLPAGVTVASPSNASTTCTSGTVTAVPGSGAISYSGGTVAAGATCTVGVDVTSSAIGTHVNTSGNLTSSSGNSGPANDTLVVFNMVISKAFLDDPTAPGGTVTLQFTIENQNASQSALNISFNDDLNAALPGLAAIGLPSNDVCGVGSQVTGSGVIAFSGGTLAAGANCTFQVTLQVPTNASAGSFPNQTSNLQAVFGANTFTFGTAVDSLNVFELTFTKEFIDDPVLPGGTLTLRFTITNTNGAATGGSINFSDDLNAALAGLAAVGLPANDVCGAGSQVSGTSTVTLTNGTLPPGQSCSFDVTLQVPAGAPLGTFFNQTSAIEATFPGGTSTFGMASDTFEVALLSFAKEFTNDPVPPGGMVTLEFTIASLDPGVGGNGLSFTDDLEAVLTGLVAIGLPANDVCGPGSMLTGTDLLVLSGGNFPAGGSCSFSVQLQIPMDAIPGVYPNVTSPLTGAIGNVALDGLFGGAASFGTVAPAAVAEDDLLVGLPPSPAAAVPTLGGWGILILAASLLLFGGRRLWKS